MGEVGRFLHRWLGVYIPITIGNISATVLSFHLSEWSSSKDSICYYTPSPIVSMLLPSHINPSTPHESIHPRVDATN
jgi:hypothetical protein